MSLLDHLNQIGSAITGFARKIPGIEPGAAPATGMEGQADPAMLALAQQQRERAYRAAYQQAARNGAQWYELGDAAGAAADQQYLPAVGQAVQLGQQNAEMGRREAKRKQLADTINGLVSLHASSGGKKGLDERQAGALSMMEPEAAAAKLFDNTGADRYSMTAMGDGAVMILDKMTGEAQIQTAGPDGTVQRQKVKNTVNDGQNVLLLDEYGQTIGSIPVKGKNLAPGSENTVYEQQYKRAEKFAPFARFYDQLDGLARDDSPFGWQALVIAFNKMLDETSVVREAEFNLTAEMGGVINRARGAVLKADGQNPLDPKLRQQMVNVARLLYTQAKERYAEVERRDRAIWKRYDLDPEMLYNPFGRATTGTHAATPPAGNAAAEAAAAIAEMKRKRQAGGR